MFLGISFEYDHDRGVLSLLQQPFIEELLSCNDLLNAKPQDVPLKTKSPHNLPVPPNPLSCITESNITKAYQSIVGSLLYLTSWTHPDIAYTVVALAQWNALPTKSMLLAAKGVLHYLLETRDWVLKYGDGDGIHTDSIVFSDTDWETPR